MIIDIRVYSELPRHRKFKRLKRLIDTNAMEYLITFWCNVAEQVPDGNLYGWSACDIADAANWNEKPDTFVACLIDAGFLDETENGFYPHNWDKHQPWVVDAENRSERARKAGQASAKARKTKYGTAQPPNGPFDERSTDTERVVELNSNPRTPSPSPSLKDYPSKGKLYNNKL